jgi:hypothetical protein
MVYRCIKMSPSAANPVAGGPQNILTSTLRLLLCLQNPLPSNVVVGDGKPRGKVQYPDPYAATNPTKVCRVTGKVVALLNWMKRTSAMLYVLGTTQSVW